MRHTLELGAFGLGEERCMAFHPLAEGCHKMADSLMLAGRLVPVAFLDMASEAASFLP